MPQVSMPTPAGGTHVHVGPEPAVPEWTLSSDDGKVHRFRDLNTLQKWIVERKVSRTDRLSRSGGPWLALGDMDELTPFFNIVDQADRPRASVRTPTPSPTRPSGASSPTSPSSSSPHVPRAPIATPPPPVPSDARKTVSPDGPTVPNRRLPVAKAAEPAESAAKRPPARTPGLGVHAAGHGLGPNTFPASGAMATPPDPGASSSSSRATPTVSVFEPPTLQMQMPTPVGAPARAPTPGPSNPGASGLRPAGGADPLRSMPPIDRPTTRSDAFFPTGPTEDGLTTDFLLPSHRRRNTMVAAVVLVLAAAVGGYAFWSQQQSSQRKVPAWMAPAPAATPPGGTLAAHPPVPGSEPAAQVQAAAKAETKPSVPDRSPGPAATAAAKADAPAPGQVASPGAGASRAEAGGAHARTGGKGAPARELEAGAAPKGGGSAGNYDRLVAEADRLLEHGQAAKAEKLYNQALAGKPDGVAARTGIAYVLLDRQRHFKAIETFRRVLDTQPTYGPALFGIAESYRARGDAAQALAAYRQYLSISPSGADAPAARRQIKDLESGGAVGGPSASRKDSDPTED
jgi:hypothetical protein